MILLPREESESECVDLVSSAGETVQFLVFNASIFISFLSSNVPNVK